jgi:iron complex transport system ATP-binding protein
MNFDHSISVKNTTLGYHKAGHTIPVLENINLDFYPGDFIGIVGLNGTGKSTLLKSICGLLPVLSGQIYIEDKNILDLSLTELAKKVAIVLTEKFGGFNLTAYDVVAAGQIPYTNSFNQLKKEHRAIIDMAISLCGIKDHQYKPVNELSDGLFQKTVIAKALAQQTGTLLLDEPTAFLDYASKHELFLLLERLSKKENKCVLVSSHDLDLILKYCNKLVVISSGKIDLIKVSEAKQNKAFIEIGGGYL